MKKTMTKTALLMTAVSALMLALAACPLPLVPSDTTQPKYVLSISESALADIHMEGEIFTALTRKITVKNEGNKVLEEVNMVITSNLDGFNLTNSSQEDISTLGNIQPGEEKSFTLSFPESDRYTPGKFYNSSTLLIGNRRVQKKIELVYGIGTFIDTKFEISRAYLQIPGIDTGDPLPPAGILLENDEEKPAGWYWYSSSPDVLEVDRETGALELKKAGVARIGLIPDDKSLPFEFRYMEITVEPAIKPLQIAYENIQEQDGKNEAILDPGESIAPDAGTEAVIDLAKNEDAAASNIRVVYAKTVLGSEKDDVFGNVDPDTGELTAAGLENAQSNVKISARITRDNADNVAVTTHWGSIDISATIKTGGNLTPAAVSTVKALVATPAVTETSNEIKIKFTKQVFISGSAKNGFTVTVGGAPASIKEANHHADTITLVMDSSFSKYKHVELNYASGDITTVGTAFPPFTKSVDLTDIGDDVTPPRIVSALVEDTSRSKVKVTFSEPVVIKDATKLGVRVAQFYKTALPAINTGTAGSILSKNTKGGVLPFITTVDKGSNDGTTSASASVWSFTMSSPAQYADIISLMATAEGAVEDEQGNKLSQVNEFVVRSTVKRTKETIEATGDAGLYINGDRKASPTSSKEGELYKDSIAWLLLNKPKDGDTIVLILDVDQTFAGVETGTIWDTISSTGKCTFIITTKAGITSDIQVKVASGRALLTKNMVTVIVEEHVDFVSSAPDSNSWGAMFAIQSGSSLILDGGKIRNHKTNGNNINAGGGVYLGNQAPGSGMGDYGSYFLMNSGEISENLLATTGLTASQFHARAGGVGLNYLSVFVMHGGTIHDNKSSQTETTTSLPYAGGICAGLVNNNSSTKMPGGAAIYITGGSVYNNSAAGTNNGASAGGVFTSGTFQKTGDAALYGNTNSVTGTGAKAKNLLIADDATGALATHNADSPAGKPIFVYAAKNGTTTSTPTYYYDHKGTTWWASGWGSNLWDNP